jgi:hypothetical protein
MVSLFKMRAYGDIFYIFTVIWEKLIVSAALELIKGFCGCMVPQR